MNLTLRLLKSMNLIPSDNTYTAYLPEFGFAKCTSKSSLEKDHLYDFQIKHE